MDRTSGRANTAAYAKLLDITKCYQNQLAIVVCICTREDLAKHLNGASLPSPCGRKFDQVFTGWTAPISGDDAKIVDRIEVGENTPERIAQFCTKATEMFSISIVRHEEDELMMTLQIIVLT